MTDASEEIAEARLRGECRVLPAMSTELAAARADVEAASPRQTSWGLPSRLIPGRSTDPGAAGSLTDRRATKLLMRGRREALRGLAAFVAATALVACTSPTLPLPPPTAPTISTGSQPDTYKLSSHEGTEPNALVIIVNRNVDLPRSERVSGTIADEHGSWEVEVVAKPGDVLDISQDTGSARSPSTTVTVR